jgi:peptidoglycan hydrolase-like protein with peptidoglycan-binding domain
MQFEMEVLFLQQKMKRLLSAATALFLTLTLSMAGTVAMADDSLKRGDSGSAVETLQKMLQKVNCYDYKEITGYFGVATEEGLRKFQSTHGLDADGVAGTDTISKLQQATKSDKPLNPNSICVGMSGQKVTDIQKRLQELGLYNEPSITGFFGPKTEAAVMAFQEAAGIKADGIVGKKTSDTLFSDFKSDSLIPGTKGDKVAALQKRLKDLGYYSGQATGLYGQATQKAVVYFQKLNGMTQDGIAGKATQAAIYSKKAKTEKAARRDPDPPKPKYTDLPGQSASGQETSVALVAYAKTFLGRPYVYGAKGPNYFDCSGLTSYVYKHFGITLPRSAQGQGYTDYGVKITSKDKLMPGDLVFFNTERHDSDLCDHVGIYVGNGNFIHAPMTGCVIRINSILPIREFSWGRRLLK